MKDGTNNYLRRIVTISKVTIILIAVMIASNAPLVLACHITASTTATAKYNQVYDWSIAKSVAPDTWTLYPGDQGTSTYNVSVTRSATARDVYNVSGTITLTNVLDRATINLTIEVYAQKNGTGSSFGSSTTKVVIKPDTQLPNGKTGTYNYEIQLPAEYVQNGRLYRVVVNIIDTGYNTQVITAFTIPATATVKNAQINVDDSNGDSWLFSSSGSQTYNETFVSPQDVGKHNNTATIRETGAYASATVTVKALDEPTRTVQFDSSSYSVAEPEKSVIKTVTVVLSNSCEMPIDVVYCTADGTAIVAAGDYVATDGTLTFNPGEMSKTFDVTLKNDGVYSGMDKFFFVNLTSVTTPIGFGINRNVTVTINELPVTVSMETESQSISEHGNSTALVYVVLNQPSTSEVTVTFSTADGTAKAGANYIQNSSTLTFEPDQTRLPIMVDIIDEWGNETPDAFFFVNLTDVSSNARIIAPDVTAVTIEDDDQTFTIDLYKGWNLVSSPLIIEPFMVSNIQDKFPQINQVMRYNTDMLKYESYLVGISRPSYDFQWENDHGYLVYSTENVSITFVGEYWGARTVSLIDGWNMVGWSTLDTSDANTICGLLDGTQQIMMYDAPTQTYHSYLEGISPIRFNTWECGGSRIPRPLGRG